MGVRLLPSPCSPFGRARLERSSGLKHEALQSEVDFSDMVTVKAAAKDGWADTRECSLKLFAGLQQKTSASLVQDHFSGSVCCEYFDYFVLIELNLLFFVGKICLGIAEAEVPKTCDNVAITGEEALQKLAHYMCSRVLFA